MKSDASQLDELKRLLLEPELEQLKQLSVQLERMDLRLEDPEEIVKRVTPLLNEILLKNLEEKEGRTVEILSEYLASVIKRASQTHLPELSEALQKVIAPAISKEIANNQEVMIDALYPIMGGMISKYVTQSIKELMEQINKKIEQGLSFERFKRKMKAKLSGVSETELLLEESSDALISSMFIIHKETGILISSASLENREIDEPHLVASMASAIKDFINDWISRSGSETIEEVQILSYANATLYIESAGSVYVIAFLDSEPDYELRSEINTFFASLVKEHGSFFRAFEGDDSSPETKEIAEEMRAYLLAQKNIHREEKGKSNFAKYILTAVALAVGGYVLYGLYVWYGEYVVEKRIARETGTLVSISRSEDKVLLEGYVDDLAKTKRIETIVKETLKPKEIVDHLHLDVRSLQNLMGKISQEKAEMRRKLDEADRKTEQSARQSEALLAKVDSLEKRLTQQEKRIAAFGKITHMEQEVAQKLAEALKGSPYYHERTQELDFAKLNLFPVLQAQYNEKGIRVAASVFEKYLSVLAPYRTYIKSIVIEGHSDSTGNPKRNLEITQKRADAAKAYFLSHTSLRNLGMDRLLTTQGVGSKKPVLVDGVEDKNASRRITVHFSLDKEKILKKAKEVLNGL